MGKVRELLHRVLSLSFLTILGKSKSRRDYFEDSLLLDKTVIFPWRAMHSVCYFCGRKEKNLSGRCPLLMPHAMKAYGSTSELLQWFILCPFKNKTHVTPCCFAAHAH